MSAPKIKDLQLFKKAVLFHSQAGVMGAIPLGISLALHSVKSHSFSKTSCSVISSVTLSGTSSRQLICYFWDRVLSLSWPLITLCYQACSQISLLKVLTLRDHILFTFVFSALHMGLKQPSKWKTTWPFVLWPGWLGKPGGRGSLSGSTLAGGGARF